MSTDETNKFRVNEIDEAPTTLEQIRQLLLRVDDLLGALREQQDELRKRGMNIPSGAIDSVRALKARLEVISKQALINQTELRQLRALAETTALITSELDTDTVLNQVMDTVIQLTGSERGYIVLKNRETGEMDEFRVARGLDREQLQSPNKTEDPNKRSDFIVSRTIVNEVAATGEPVLTDNASKDERYQEKHSIVGYALRSILAVPLKVRGEIIGVVYCDNRILPGLFQKHELELLTAFANQAAVAIDNARLFESVRAQLAQVTEMRDVMNNIFESIISGVITTDNALVVTTCNIAGRSIVNVEGEIVGQALDKVLPTMPDEFYPLLERVQTTGLPVLLEANPVLPLLERRLWNLNVSLLRDMDGQGQGLAIVIDDLTEQKMREAQLAEVGRYLPTALVKNIRSIDDVNVGGQEREITAIFADVRGFTAFSERLEPEVLMQVINKYLSVASDAINLYEGIVDKYMGDAVTGLFNTQLNPQDDHALRAVRATMSIMYDLYALHEVLPQEQRLFYGIGIHTGMAVLGNVGSSDRKEFAALGEAPDICKALQENAGPGEIIISETTYQLVRNDFECEPVILQKTKGRTDLPQAYKVLRRKKGAAPSSLFIDPELADLLNDTGSLNL